MKESNSNTIYRHEFAVPESAVDIKEISHFLPSILDIAENFQDNKWLASQHHEMRLL